MGQNVRNHTIGDVRLGGIHLTTLWCRLSLSFSCFDAGKCDGEGSVCCTFLEYLHLSDGAGESTDHEWLVEVFYMAIKVLSPGS